ncbi:putative 5-formyltetrahydrofolate cyclo-ligase family protein [Gordonia araii NBRC 100433]|uniref:5-formyltetrahydrofolate cyclo-ligase n=1 Tax=Gordonia araii NBRC 100433 TaxID=1073574 RepID=G7H3M9_9ACTN|nr:5-formyltetrahydrofolate cyclo-ligase [Gordonia araii]NNG96571.1 5-formyltetrahydrofolate cyclo-ligase [Gordonia araii NBRC 100433]GAB10454.1 putative 5-formyltetrahydrofolate cyclo-ligase family protein [Gordonia araii NBRC 100433]
MSKQEVRGRLRAHRERLSVFDVESAAVNLAEWMYRLPMAVDEGATIACYLPVGSEPGSDAMLDALVDQGYRVIVPVVPDGDPQPLRWAVYSPSAPLETRRWGLAEPTSPSLGPGALAEASVVFVPALAVARDGARLGRGAGYYDRSLPLSRAVRIGVVYDHELVDELPTEPTDVPMEWALTPEAGFTRLD